MGPPLLLGKRRIRDGKQATQTGRDCQQGKARIDAIREVRITEQTFYRWRKQYGGMGTVQLKELKRLQKENERLRRAVSDLTLDKLILSEASRGNF
jgi:putative transposase